MSRSGPEASGDLSGYFAIGAGWANGGHTAPHSPVHEQQSARELMTKWHSVAALIILAATLGSRCIAQDLNPTQPFVFCYQDIELFPNYTGPSSDVPETNRGVVVELVEQAAAQAGLKPAFVRYPWNRCLSLMRQGRVDSVVASYRHERLTSAVYPTVSGKPDVSKLITFSGYYLYQTAGQPDYWDGNAFISDDLVVGTPLGYSITNELKEQGRPVLTSATVTGLLQMLAHGRLEAVAAPGAAADNLILSNADLYAGIKKVDAPLKINPYFIVFSHQFQHSHPDKVQIVWDVSLKTYQDHFSRLRLKYAKIGSSLAQQALEEEE